MRRSYALLFVSLFAIDRFTKVVALLLFPQAVTFNPKAFFFFGNSDISLFAFFVFVIVLGWWFIHELARATRRSFMMSGAAGMLAGALSNFLDRIRYGAIIDWFAIPGLTVFNLADVFIIFGCALALFSFFRRKQV